MNKEDEEIVIIGAGLVGSLLSIFLCKRGYHVRMFERRGDMRRTTVEAGRSINLALSDRGLLALRKAGIEKDILSISIPMHGRAIHNPDGSEAFQPYGTKGQYINSVSRSALNSRLLDLAESHGVQVEFGHKCTHIDWSKKSIRFTNEKEGQTDVVFSRCLATDGAYSSARLAHMLQHEKFDYHQAYIDCGYKEISIPSAQDGRHLLTKEALHIWPRKEFMLIALPNQDGSFTGTLFFPFTGDASFESLNTPEKVADFFATNFPDVKKLVPDLEKQFYDHPLSSLVTVKCFPWKRDDSFLLLGDAAHAIVPFFGQGMNAGFEDCIVLDKLLDEQDGDWEAVFENFQTVRKPDTDAIADLAVTNFTEMRERTADPLFLLQKKIEMKLHAHHPELWIPAYSQVTFSPDISYSQALANSLRQEAIMQDIMKMPDIANRWNHAEIEELILQKLNASSDNNKVREHKQDTP